MTKFKFLAALFVSALALSSTACGDDDNTDNPTPPPAPTKITLSISGGEAVTVDGADVTKPITITASGKSDKDISVTLANNGTAGQVTFATNPVIIKAGKLASEGATVTFTKAGFPEGAAEKNIDVTISSTTANVVIGTPAKTTFGVKGANGVELPTVAVTANGPEFNTTANAVDAKVTFTLAKALDVALPITVAYASDSELKAPALATVTIAAQATEAILTIPVAQGVAGTMKLTFAAEATLDKTTQTFTFVKDEAPAVIPVASIEAKDGTDVTVDGENVTKTFTIKLDKATTKSVTVNLALTGNDYNGASLGKASVTFDANDQEEEATIIFSKDVYETASNTGTITVNATAANSNLTINDSKKSIVYTVKGTDAPISKPNVSIATQDNLTAIVVDQTDITKTITATLSAPVSTETLVTLNVTDNNANNGATLSGNITIPANQTTGTAQITFKQGVFNSADVTADVTVTATATDATVATGTIVYQVKGTTAATGPKQQLDLKFSAAGEPGVLVANITNDAWIYIFRAKAQEGNITVHYKIDGFTAEECWLSGGSIGNGERSIEGNLTIKPEDFGVFNLNVGSCQTSKKGTITFTSPDAEINSANSVITVNLTK